MTSIPREFQGLLLTTPRLRRDQRTVEAILRIWCEGKALHIRARGDELCGGCDSLLDYATHKLFLCPFGEEKPTCMKCRVHCYARTTREQMREVMRRVGPHMLYRHPVLAYHHLRAGKRAAPRLEKKQEMLGGE